MDDNPLIGFIVYSNLLTKAGLGALLTAGILVLFRATRERAVQALGPAFLLCLLGMLLDFADGVFMLSCSCGGTTHLWGEPIGAFSAALLLVLGIFLTSLILAAARLPLRSMKDLLRAGAGLPVVLLDLAVIGVAMLAISRPPLP